MEQRIEQLREVKGLLENLPPEFQDIHTDFAELYEKVRIAQLGIAPVSAREDRPQVTGGKRPGQVCWSKGRVPPEWFTDPLDLIAAKRRDNPSVSHPTHEPLQRPSEMWQCNQVLLQYELSRSVGLNPCTAIPLFRLSRPILSGSHRS